MERRSLPTTYQHDGNRLVGYAAVWDAPTTITERGKTFTEIVRRGAFTRALRSTPDILCCFNHDVNRLLGRTASRTLTVTEDDHGLKFEVLLPDTPTGEEVRQLAARNDLTGASFAFTVRKDAWADGTREIQDVDLYELGPVVAPAYGATNIGLRSKTRLYAAQMKLMERTI
jgi:hypothetical protein